MPRISVIGAVDTEGQVYVSLTQVVTDNEIIKLFLSKLAIRLDSEQANWREKSILMMDSAKYHTSEEVKNHLKTL